MAHNKMPERINNEVMPIWQQIDAMDIDRNLLYCIGGELDHITTLLSVISRELEYFEDDLKRQEVSSLALAKIKEFQSLVDITTDVREKADKFLGELVEQMER